MKSGMTRWKMVPLYWPFFTYFRKFSTVLGAASGSSSRMITPMEVTSFTFGLTVASRPSVARDKKTAIKARIRISGGCLSIPGSVRSQTLGDGVPLALEPLFVPGLRDEQGFKGQRDAIAKSLGAY